MALKEMPSGTKDPEQLTFKAFELAEAIRDMIGVETAKKEANEEWNIQLKALKKRMVKLAYEVKDAGTQKVS